MTGGIEPGVLEAILSTADAETDEERDALWNGYLDSGYEDLADAVGYAEDVIDEASCVVLRLLLRDRFGVWLYRNGREI